MGGVDEVVDVVDVPVVRVDREEVRDVIAAVAQRRVVEGQQPDAVDAQPLEVVELLDQTAEVAGAVSVAVEEATDVDLVEDGGLEPERLGLEPVGGAGLAGGGVHGAGAREGFGRAVHRWSTRTTWAWRSPGTSRT